MPGQRIKFRGLSQQPYIVGAGKSHDSKPWAGRRRPRYKEILINDAATRLCTSCERVIKVGSRYYRKGSRDSVHELC